MPASSDCGGDSGSSWRHCERPLWHSKERSLDHAYLDGQCKPPKPSGGPSGTAPVAAGTERSDRAAGGRTSYLDAFPKTESRPRRPARWGPRNRPRKEGGHGREEDGSLLSVRHGRRAGARGRAAVARLGAFRGGASPRRREITRKEEGCSTTCTSTRRSSVRSGRTSTPRTTKRPTASSGTERFAT